MNWFPSKVRDAASFQFKMYREVSRHYSLSTGRFARELTLPALSYELNSIFLLLYEEMNALGSWRVGHHYRFYGGTMGRHVNI